MNIYVYSDESGVFDKEHNDYFVFGGLILLGTEDKEIWSRKYSNVEKTLQTNKGVARDYELKATQVTNKEKGKLFRSLNGCHKFGVIIREKNVLDRIYLSTTATNGRYELQEALEQEFKLGTYNYQYDTYYPPIFKKMKDVQLEYCNSQSKLLVRAADIVANKIYYCLFNGVKTLAFRRNL